MEKHKIDWLNMEGFKGETWNPIIGCSKISAGCTNCYAEKMAGRLANIESTNYYKSVCKYENMSGGNEFENPDQWRFKGWNNETLFVETSIDKPMSWKKPRMIFVCSMGDLFHESVLFHQITEIINTIQICPQHIFIILTKRPDRMREYFYENPPLPFSVLQNMWLGVTAENQDQADKRIPILLDIPAAKRFVSIEPMLGEMDITNKGINNGYSVPTKYTDDGTGIEWTDPGPKFIGLHWVICGGESGHNARPMHPNWVISIRDQCKEANTKFFFKQWGEWGPEGTTKNYNLLNPKKEISNGVDVMVKKGRSKTGSELDGAHYKEFPISK